MNDLSLYIHIPFCHKSKCLYCDFVSLCGKEPHYNRYISALCQEIKLQKQTLSNHKIKTIFIGGGTPSVLSTKQISQIFQTLSKCADLSFCKEITIEINPDTTTLSKLKTYKRLGINRISMGAQSMNDLTLKAIGRRHNSKVFKKALSMATSVFENVSVDMMLGLPHQTKSDIQQMIDYLSKNKVEHVSAYSLILEEGIPLRFMANRGEISLPSEDETIKMYDLACKKLKQNGFCRYEVSNFAKKGRESKHNLVYWQGGEYLGLGLGAHSYLGEMRFCNTTNFDEYCNQLPKMKLPQTSHENISKEQKREETIMLSLRTKWGIDLDSYQKQFGKNLLVERQPEIDFLRSQKLVKITKKHLSLTQKGFHVLNSVVLKLV